MTRLQHRRDARRTQHRVVRRRLRQRRGSVGVSTVRLDDRLHRRTEVASFECSRPLEERVRDFIEVDREIEFAEPIERSRQSIDRVVAHRH